MRFVAACFALAIGLMAGAASATRYQMTAIGTVDRIAALSNDEGVATPAGIIAVGDAFTLSAFFDTDTAELTPHQHL